MNEDQCGCQPNLLLLAEVHVLLTVHRGNYSKALHLPRDVAKMRLQLLAMSAPWREEVHKSQIIS
jgi:hypothetical protein